MEKKKDGHYTVEYDGHGGLEDLHRQRASENRQKLVRKATKAFQKGNESAGNAYGRQAVMEGKAAKFWRRRMEGKKK